MIVTVLIIAHNTLLNALRSHVKGQMDLAVLCSGCGEDSQFYGVQRTSGVSSCHICQKLQGILINHSIIAPHSSFRIVHCPPDQFLHFRDLQSPQLKNDRSGKERAVYLKIWILGCSSDKNDGPVLHKRKEVILLSFVETMDLIDKKDRFLSIHTKFILSLLHYSFHVFLACYRCVDLCKIRACSIGDDFCQCSLSCSRRAVKNNRGKFIGLDSAVQQFIFSYNVLLSYYLIQGPGAQSGCKRGLLIQGF